MSAALEQSAASAWLAIQCRMIPGISRAAVRLVDGDSGTTVFWPEDATATRRFDAALTQCLSGGAPVVSSDDPEPGASGPRPLIVGCPIRQGDKTAGAVALAIDAANASHEPRALVQWLTWGIAWLEHLHRQESTAAVMRLSAVVDAASAGLEHGSCEAAAGAAATQLSRALGCDRVSIGLMHRDRLRRVAMSDTAIIDRRARLARDIENAMDEAVGHGRPTAHPASDGAQAWTADRHARLADRHGDAAVLTVPLCDDGHIAGAICLQRRDGEPFAPAAVEMIETAALLLGPVLVLKQREARGFAPRLADGLRDGLGRLVGPTRPWLKAGVIAAAALVAWLSFATGVHRVSAEAMLEGAVQRALVAPIDSYVAETSASAGDLVAAGDVVATLESDDLALERRRWQSEVDELVREHRRAVASLDRSAASILEAQIGKARARVALIDAQLERTRITAPIDGVIVKGDLSRSLGAPVQRGQVLFEVAPMGRYQVVLHVPEASIANVEPGQRGTMALAAVPGQRFGFTVDQVIGVAGVRDGENVFRVEARLDESDDTLRPGMHGVGKIEVAERRLLWIWGHELSDSLGLWAWKHLP